MLKVPTLTDKGIEKIIFLIEHLEDPHNDICSMDYLSCSDFACENCVLRTRDRMFQWLKDTVGLEGLAEYETKSR